MASQTHALDPPKLREQIKALFVGCEKQALSFEVSFRTSGYCGADIGGRSRKRNWGKGMHSSLDEALAQISDAAPSFSYEAAVVADLFAHLIEANRAFRFSADFRPGRKNAFSFFLFDKPGDEIAAKKLGNCAEAVITETLHKLGLPVPALTV